MKAYRITETETHTDYEFTAEMTAKEIQKRYPWLVMGFWTSLVRVELMIDSNTRLVIEKIND